MRGSVSKINTPGVEGECPHPFFLTFIQKREIHPGRLLGLQVLLRDK